jgi:hypothetical protein
LGNLLGDAKNGASPEVPSVSGGEGGNGPKALGGLESLLRGAKAISQTEASPLAMPAETTPGGAGGAPSDQPDVTATPTALPPASLFTASRPAPAAGTGLRIPGSVLLAADLLLVGLAALLVFKSPVPLKPWEVVVCVTAVVLGAWFGCAAVLTRK